MNMLNFNVAFGGFYESLHSGHIDNMIDNYFDEENYYSEDINYSLIYKKYSERYVEFLNEYLKDEFELNSNLEFIGIDSPNEYNFRTDEIIVSVDNKIGTKIIDLFSKNEECISFIEENSISRSGFISFFDGYSEVKKNQEIHLQYIFKYINYVSEDEFEQYYDFNCMYELLNEINFSLKG